MVDLLDEAREAVQQEQMLALAKKYGALVLLGTIALIIGIIGWQMWHAREIRRAGEASVAYFEALEKIQAGNKKDGHAALEAIAKDGPKGYRTIAALQLAALKVDAGKTKEAVANYQEIAKGSGDPALRELAVLLAAQLEDKTPPDTDGIWKFSALEQQGVKQLQAKEYDKARDSFSKVTTDPATPRGLRQHAAELIVYTNYLEDNKL